MIVGFNHNINYRGVGFHVQTEDTGAKSSTLVTLLYHGGTIIASQKTVYADIIKVAKLDKVVEDLAKEQHKGMLRRLTRGEFDEKILDLGIPLGPAPAREAEPEPEPVSDAQDVPVETIETVADAPLPASDQVLPEALPIQPPIAEPVTIVEESIIDKFRKPEPDPETTLDDLIYAYLSGQETV